MCALNTFIGCYGWEMVFRASPGLGHSVCDIWLHGARGGSENPELKTVMSTPPGVYISPLIKQWRLYPGTLSISLVQQNTYIYCLTTFVIFVKS